MDSITITIEPLSDTEYDLTMRFKDSSKRKAIDAHLRREVNGSRLAWMLDVFDSSVMTHSKAHIDTVQVNGWVDRPEWQEVFAVLRERL